MLKIVLTSNIFLPFGLYYFVSIKIFYRVLVAKWKGKFSNFSLKAYELYKTSAENLCLAVVKKVLLPFAVKKWWRIKYLSISWNQQQEEILEATSARANAIAKCKKVSSTYYKEEVSTISIINVHEKVKTLEICKLLNINVNFVKHCMMTLI